MDVVALVAALACVGPTVITEEDEDDDAAFAAANCANAMPRPDGRGAATMVV